MFKSNANLKTELEAAAARISELEAENTTLSEQAEIAASSFEEEKSTMINRIDELEAAEANHAEAIAAAKEEVEETKESVDEEATTKANDLLIDKLAEAGADVTLAAGAAAEEATASFEERQAAAAKEGGVAYAKFIRDNNQEVKDYIAAQR